MADVVREEVRTVRADLADAARPATAGLLLLGAAAGCAVLGVGAASVTALRLMETVLPRLLAAAALTAGYVAGAAVLGGAGLANLQTAGGGSRRLADQIRDAVRQTVGRTGQSAASAAREAAAE
jgi:hypothetical protein